MGIAWADATSAADAATRAGGSSRARGKAAAASRVAETYVPQSARPFGTGVARPHLWLGDDASAGAAAGSVEGHSRSLSDLLDLGFDGSPGPGAYDVASTFDGPRRPLPLRSRPVVQIAERDAGLDDVGEGRTLAFGALEHDRIDVHRGDVGMPLGELAGSGHAPGLGVVCAPACCAAGVDAENDHCSSPACAIKIRNASAAHCGT